MQRVGDWFRLEVPGVKAGQRYGYRAEGRYDPDQGFWFDASKLLVDPYATELDRPFRHDQRLTLFGEETADLVPKAILTRHKRVRPKPPLFRSGGLIYEVQVRAFTILSRDMAEAVRGTVSALAHPSVVAHLKRLGVSAVELMPITASIDERHLPPLGLRNAWGYNPVALMALDPRLCPGGVTELRETVAALRAEGIGVILDLVLNHTGESDRNGATLCHRGLDNRTAYRHVPGAPGTLINDTGCGNTIACDHPVMRRLILDCLRHFVEHTGVDGFRFDLAPILFRTQESFDPDGETARNLLSDPVLSDRILIAEPWDVGPGGYRLGGFPKRFLEWNDRARDNIRRAWRGDSHMNGALATALAGSSDVFGPSGQARGVTFLAAHDGFTLWDLVSHARKHNEANGENNKDGHDDNHSWNNGAEGQSLDEEVLARRRGDVKALLSTLFATRGAIMLTAGDEAGRSQKGNNNAYAQDNRLTWFDWETMDEDILTHAEFLAALRGRFTVFAGAGFFDGSGDVTWLHPEEGIMRDALWERAEEMALGMLLDTQDRLSGVRGTLAVLVNRGRYTRRFMLPGDLWTVLSAKGEHAAGSRFSVDARKVEFLFATQA